MIWDCKTIEARVGDLKDYFENLLQAPLDSLLGFQIPYIEATGTQKCLTLTTLPNRP